MPPIPKVSNVADENEGFLEACLAGLERLLDQTEEAAAGAAPASDVDTDAAAPPTVAAADGAKKSRVSNE